MEEQQSFPNQKNVSFGGTFRYAPDSHAFTNVGMLYYFVIDIGVDSLELRLTECARYRFELHPEQWVFRGKAASKTGRTTYRWAGPKCNGAFLRFRRTEWENDFCEQIILNLQPDAFLGYECCPARGEMLLSALRSVASSRWLANAIGSVTIEELLNAGLARLEIAADVTGLPDVDIDELPMSHAVGRKYVAQYGEGYVLAGGKSGACVVYRKGDRLRIEQRLYPDGLDCFFNRQSGEKPKSTLDYLRYESLANKLKRRLDSHIRITEGVDIVSSWVARDRAYEDNPRCLARLIDATNLGRELAHKSKKCRSEHNWMRRELKARYKIVIGTLSPVHLAIRGMAEAVGRSYSLLQTENSEAYHKLTSQPERAQPCVAHGRVRVVVRDPSASTMIEPLTAGFTHIAIWGTKAPCENGLLVCNLRVIRERVNHMSVSRMALPDKLHSVSASESLFASPSFHMRC